MAKQTDKKIAMKTVALALCAAALAAARAPDTSLETTPVAYYGANWNRSQLNIDILAKMQMVVLMQEDGHCWATCCPNRFGPGNQCGWNASLPPATSIDGCDSSCEQHGAQEAVFKRIKASALRQGLRCCLGQQLLLLRAFQEGPRGFFVCSMAIFNS